MKAARSAKSLNCGDAATTDTSRGASTTQTRLADLSQASSPEAKVLLHSRMQGLAEKRKADLERRRRTASEEQQKLRSRKYMHDVLAADFHLRVELPEEQRLAFVLAQKRLLCAPLQPSELQSHAQRFQQLQRERRQQKREAVQRELLDAQVRFHSVNRCKLAREVLERDLTARALRQQEAEESRSRIEKKKRYTSLVREMFVPRTDPLKKAELEERKFLLTPKRVPRLPSMKSASPILVRRKRINPSPPLPEKQVVITDWLGEMRRRRDNFELRELRDASLLSWKHLSPRSNARKLRAQARDLECKAKKRELLLDQVTTMTSKVLDINENVTAAYLASAKAKLEFLVK